MIIWKKTEKSKQSSKNERRISGNVLFCKKNSAVPLFNSFCLSKKRRIGPISLLSVAYISHTEPHGMNNEAAKFAIKEPVAPINFGNWEVCRADR